MQIRGNSWARCSRRWRAVVVRATSASEGIAALLYEQWPYVIIVMRVSRAEWYALFIACARGLSLGARDLPVRMTAYAIGGPEARGRSPPTFQRHVPILSSRVSLTPGPSPS